MIELTKRRQALKEKFRRRDKVFAGWTCFSHPSLAEILARMGVDFIGIDMEHTPISEESALHIITSAQGSGTLCLPRVASHDVAMIKRLLDSGADGIIVPLISSKAEAQKVCDIFLYPPLGKRSFGVGRAQGFGFDYDAYTKNWNSSGCLIAQIETKEGVENIDDILTVKGIDAIMVGPYDISGSLGIPGQLDHPKVKEARKKVIKACQAAKKSCGIQVIHPNPTNMRQALEEGFNFIVTGADLFALWGWAADMNSLIGNLKAKR
jgi:2-keto-3-deoxy-L-rhamnonate aldolase RhmA